MMMMTSVVLIGRGVTGNAALCANDKRVGILALCVYMWCVFCGVRFVVCVLWCAFCGALQKAVGERFQIVDALVSCCLVQ